MAGHKAAAQGGVAEAQKMDLPNLNTISREEMHKLHVPGFTGTRIDAVIDYRDKHGPFGSFDDVKNVGMIGEKMEHTLEDHFTL